VEAIRWIFPLLFAALAVSVFAGVAQGGFVFAPEALAPKPERISPGSKLQQMVSLAALSTILKSLLPFSAIAWVGFACIRSHWTQILLSSYTDARQFAGMTSGILLEICWKSGLILLAWGAVDYALLWRKNESDLKMSREDLKEEMKQSDGNPQSKARIRKLQRHNRRKQMLKAAETATVVVTNPTHYAVALRYEVNMPAPIVVAKGLDNLARRIKEIAWQRDIPVMENKPLAQALYKGVEVGDPIPGALYHAVAEILVLVYKAQAEVRKREAQRRAASMNPIPQVRPL
jgi:flagellar biosynthetic protein FlhB